MKKIIAVVATAAIIVSLAPDYVLSQGEVKKINNYTIKASAKGIHGPSLTLSDCYKMSLLQSEIIAINTDLIKETEAHFLQALSIMMPYVSYVSTDYQEEKSPLSGTSTLGSLKPPSSSVRNFNYSQTIFSGFKAFAAIKGADYEKGQRTSQKIRAEQLLLVDVADAFYLLLEYRGDLKTLRKIEAALNKRIKELRARERLGRSRPSEVVNAKAQLYGVKASIEAVASREVVARQLLEFLVGKSIGEIVDTYEFPIPVLAQDYYLSRAFLRPDVEAAKYAWDLSKQEARVIDSDFLPKVDIEANYYTQRTGFNKGTDWDLALVVNVPIFEGTEVIGKSKAAHLQADQSRLLYQRTKRKAPYDIKEAYVRFTAAMKVHDALRKAYTTAKLNYYLQRKDYERSLVNNLDVLAAIQTLQDTERNYIHALYEAKRNYWQLRVSVGQSGTESLNDAF